MIFIMEGELEMNQGCTSIFRYLHGLCPFIKIICITIIWALLLVLEQITTSESCQ